MTEFTDKELVDVIIVGAGPAGLTAAMYCARAGLRTVIFGDPYSSQLARAGTVENFITWTDPNTKGIQIIEKMLQHAEQFGAELVEKEVRQIVRTDKNLFHVYDQDGKATCSHAVIIASGTKHKKLGVKGEEEYYAKGVGYCTICDGPLYKGQPIAIVGHGNEAARAALRMASIASHVYVLATKPRLGGDLELMNELEAASNVDLFEGTRPLEIVGGPDGNVNGIVFKHESFTKQLKVKAVFVEVGVLPSTALAADLGIELSGQFIKVGPLQETNVPGVFAAGDITGGQARQAIISAGDGARAAIGVIDYIKKLGVSATKLKMVQWGSSRKATKTKSKKEVASSEGADTEVKGMKNSLRDYVLVDDGFKAGYERYTPNEDIIYQIKDKKPQAHVIAVSAYWCPDCRRNVPKMAKILESLIESGWTAEVFSRDDEGIAERFNVKKIPTFIILDENGKEMERIIENPKYSSLEEDLLKIIEGNY